MRKQSLINAVTNARLDPVVVEVFTAPATAIRRPPVEIYLRGVSEDPDSCCVPRA